MSAEALARGPALAGRQLRRLLAPRSRAASASTRAATSATRRCAASSWATPRRERAATRRRDRAPCRSSCAQAMREGALGFSSSQLDIHVAHDGREVPSNHAAPEELVALAAVLARVRPRRARVHPAQLRRRATTTPTASCSSPWLRVSGRPIELNTLTPLPASTRRLASAALEFAREAFARRRCASTRCSPTNKLGAHFALDSTFLFDEMPSFRDDAHPAARRARARACAIRRCARACARELADPTGRAFVFVWQIVRGRGGARCRSTRAGSAASVSELADGARRRIRSTASSTCRSPRTSRRSSSLEMPPSD